MLISFQKLEHAHLNPMSMNTLGMIIVTIPKSFLIPFHDDNSGTRWILSGVIQSQFS